MELQSDRKMGLTDRPAGYTDEKIAAARTLISSKSYTSTKPPLDMKRQQQPTPHDQAPILITPATREYLPHQTDSLWKRDDTVCIYFPHQCVSPTHHSVDCTFISLENAFSSRKRGISRPPRRAFCLRVQPLCPLQEGPRNHD